MMADDSKPVLPFGKLSVTKHDAMGDTMGDTSNKTAPQYGTEDANTLQAAMSGEITLGDLYAGRHPGREQPGRSCVYPDQ